MLAAKKWMIVVLLIFLTGVSFFAAFRFSTGSDVFREEHFINEFLDDIIGGGKNNFSARNKSGKTFYIIFNYTHLRTIPPEQQTRTVLSHTFLPSHFNSLCRLWAGGAYSVTLREVELMRRLLLMKLAVDLQARGKTRQEDIDLAVERDFDKVCRDRDLDYASLQLRKILSILGYEKIIYSPGYDSNANNFAGTVVAKKVENYTLYRFLYQIEMTSKAGVRLTNRYYIGVARSQSNELSIIEIEKE